MQCNRITLYSYTLSLLYNKIIIFNDQRKEKR